MLKQKLKDRQGAVTINIIIVSIVLIPLFFFLTVELNYIYLAKFKFQNFNDRIALSASMAVDKESLSGGIIRIDEEMARERADKRIVTCYRMTDIYTLGDYSYLRELPDVKIYVVNDVPPGGMEFATDEGYSYDLKNPAVIVYAEYKPKGIMFSGMTNLKEISAYEVKFKESGSILQIPSTPEVAPMSIYVTNVTNPYRFNKASPFTEKLWSFPAVPMSVGSNVEIATSVNDASLNVNSVRGYITVEGQNEDGQHYSYTEMAEMVPGGDVSGSGLSLRTVASPDANTATWVITNPYNMNIIVNWSLNDGSTGSVVASPAGDTYFETSSVSPVTTIHASANGEVLTNGILNSSNEIAPRTYSPVPNNNGNGLLLTNRFYYEFNVPDNCPTGATVSVHFEAQGTDSVTGDPRVVIYPVDGQANIGIVENKIEGLLLYNKK